jgi:hypothetical protein
VMYGLLPRLTVMATATGSNHHSAELPPDFPDHNTPQIGVKLPYRFNGVNVYAKYRFLSRDGLGTHFRAAAYAEYGFLKVPHDEAEPNLLDDTRGFGGGLIATWLHQRFAASLTTGIILPGSYRGLTPDWQQQLPGVPTEVRYGRAFNYSLSLGYLLFPRQQKDYSQTAFSLYCEFLGKSHGAARIFFDNLGAPGTPYEVSGAGVEVLRRNWYLEVHPSIQAVIASNLRIDLAVGVPLIRRSTAHYYPMYTLNVQRYLFPRRR